MEVKISKKDNTFEKRIDKASLANRAIRAWMANEVERKERRVNQTVKFAEDAKKEFDRQFPNEKVISTEAINPSNVKIVCGGVTFIAQRNLEHSIVFFVEVKCQCCGKQFLPVYANNVIDLVTIGNRLSVPQTCEECERDKKEEVEFQSTAELVLEKVVEIYDLIKEE